MTDIHPWMKPEERAFAFTGKANATALDGYVTRDGQYRQTFKLDAGGSVTLPVESPFPETRRVRVDGQAVEGAR